MVITLSISILGMLAQALVLQNRIGGFSLVPSWRQKTISNVASFGAFSWLQAISGIAFNQADRFFVGFFMGASAAGYYGLCVQAAQPIHGLIASGMHCLFPHLSARYSVTPISEIRRKVMFATTINILLVGVLFAPALVFGKHILTKWMGTTFGQRPPQIFPVIVCGFAFLGMNVTAHYALLAMGKVRIVTYLNLIAGIAMLLLMVMFIPNQGLQGTALARLIYGPITCLAYWWLYSILRNAKPYTDISQPAIHEVAATVE
jgi:O-antigen/teichoic acid export membrane protein